MPISGISQGLGYGCATAATASGAPGGGGPPLPEATGGTVTTYSSFKVHSFTADANFVVTTGGTMSFLIVGGGGGGGSFGGGFRKRPY